MAEIPAVLRGADIRPLKFFVDGVNTAARSAAKFGTPVP